MSSTDTNSSDQADKELNNVFSRTCSDVLKEILEGQELKEPLRRLIIIGRIKYSNQKVVERLHEQLVASIQHCILEVENRISGILIIHENFFYHVCESSDQFLRDIIEGTAELVAKKIILGAKVIRNSGTLKRFFSDWSTCKVKTPSYKESAEKIEENGEESSVLAIAQMIKKLEDAVFVLGSFLKFVPPQDFENKINELVPIGVLLFRNELIDLLAEKFFLTVQEHVKTYLNLREYVSFVEREWPPNGPVNDPKRYFDELDSLEKEIDKNLQQEEEHKKMKAKPGVFWWTVKASKQ